MIKNGQRYKEIGKNRKGKEKDPQQALESKKGLITFCFY